MGEDPTDVRQNKSGVGTNLLIYGDIPQDLGFNVLDPLHKSRAYHLLEWLFETWILQFSSTHEVKMKQFPDKL